MSTSSRRGNVQVKGVAGGLNSWLVHGSYAGWVDVEAAGVDDFDEVEDLLAAGEGA